jgi:hypothetical protein
MVKIVWGDDQLPIYLCAWHVLKGWRLHSMGKIKDSGMRCAILDDLHTVVYMPIEPSEIIKSFTQHLFSDSWTRYFWTYYFQVGL